MSLKLTCVTATFNCVAVGNGERLIRCIQSVAKLKTPHEHLIYDGASKDGTVELLRGMENECPTLTVASEPDAGIYDALNKGVNEAKGEWFYVLGADDYIVHPEVLDEMFRRLIHVDAVVSPVERGVQNFLYKTKKDMRRIFWAVPYSHQGLIVRTEQMRRFGGFDTRYKICADWDFMLKLHESHVRFMYRNDAYAYYADGGVSEVGDTAKMEVADILAKHLNLSAKSKQALIERRVLPFVKMLPYVVHPDCAFRMGARHMILRRILDFLGLIDPQGVPRIHRKH